MMYSYRFGILTFQKCPRHKQENITSSFCAYRALKTAGSGSWQSRMHNASDARRLAVFELPHCTLLSSPTLQQLSGGSATTTMIRKRRKKNKVRELSCFPVQGFFFQAAQHISFSIADFKSESSPSIDFSST